MIEATYFVLRVFESVELEEIFRRDRDDIKYLRTYFELFDLPSIEDWNVIDKEGSEDFNEYPELCSFWQFEERGFLFEIQEFHYENEMMEVTH
jgi:hypothetical protein